MIGVSITTIARRLAQFEGESVTVHGGLPHATVSLRLYAIDVDPKATEAAAQIARPDGEYLLAPGFTLVKSDRFVDAGKTSRRRTPVINQGRFVAVRIGRLHDDRGLLVRRDIDRNDERAPKHWA